MMVRKMEKIYVAGHNGIVGSACCRALRTAGYSNVIMRSSKELDLRNQGEVDSFIKTEKPSVIIDAAAKVGGILANDTFPYQFLMDNMQIQNNLISSAHAHGVGKFIFLGSSCIYPKLASQPLKEDYLLTGALEPTNEWYAIAKISGVKLIEAIRRQYGKNFLSLMPTNLYGPNDNFDLASSHVLPAMMRKFYDAKMKANHDVVLWGSGSPLREFLHVDDLASAVLFALENELSHHIYNVGSGQEVSIEELAIKVQRVVGHDGRVKWDKTKPDGTPRKLLDTSRLSKEGWRASIELNEGLKSTFDWYVENQESLRFVQ